MFPVIRLLILLQPPRDYFLRTLSIATGQFGQGIQMVQLLNQVLFRRRGFSLNVGSGPA